MSKKELLVVAVGLGIFAVVNVLTRRDTELTQQAMDQAAQSVVAAVERYRRERGALPETLQALIPAYLAAVPQCAPQIPEPVEYHRRGTGGYELFCPGARIGRYRFDPAARRWDVVPDEPPAAADHRAGRSP